MKEVHDHMLALDEKKACGYDNIPVRLIKDGASILAEPLKTYLQSFIGNRKFP